MWIVTGILISIILSFLLAFGAVPASQHPATATQQPANATQQQATASKQPPKQKFPIATNLPTKKLPPLVEEVKNVFVNDKLEKEFLEAHNKARAPLGVPPLLWDKKLAQYSKEYGMKRAQDCKMIHSNGSYGENLFWSLKSSWTPAMAVSSWVDEGKNYNRNANSCAPGKKCGHYTQVMWRKTARLGCARIKCNNYTGFLSICNYDPPGNFDGESPFDNKQS